MTDRDYSALLESGDVAIKFWLPELMETVLNECCSFVNTTRSDLIRQSLFIYLYGRYDLFGLVEQKCNHYQLNPPSRVLYSKSLPPEEFETEAMDKPDLMQDLGKNIEDLKVWIPRKMRDDIQVLADQASLTLSEMVREILISMFFGHTYLPQRQGLAKLQIEVDEEEHQ